ncbi:TetR/AcrR family transcriptional regulator [Actinomadura madurae]|uniref:TetR/AcrR family transcriptional regulator n=1 Tax=Actinomadura madurae TaxID=1993 RepID=UPI00399A25C8
MDETDRQPHGGRGARERILWAAAKLFYLEGINATGLERLTDVAHVSKRTFYKHFPSKDALVEAYLRRFHYETPLSRTQVLDDESLTPRERLLALFEPPTPGTALRGCPFHNAAVEICDIETPVRTLVADYKEAFAERLAATAAEAGASNPRTLGRQLNLLFEGVTALSTSANSADVFTDARTTAEILLDASLSTS